MIQTLSHLRIGQHDIYAPFIQSLEQQDLSQSSNKLALSLFYLEQLTIPEISAVLGIPSGTVKSRLHKAKLELKELWKHDTEGDIP